LIKSGSIKDNCVRITELAAAILGMYLVAEGRKVGEKEREHVLDQVCRARKFLEKALDELDALLGMEEASEE